MTTQPVGAGRIVSFHGESVARRPADANLLAIADPAPGAVEKLAAKFGAPKTTIEVSERLNDPAVEAALAIALACIGSVKANRPVAISQIAAL